MSLMLLLILFAASLGFIAGGGPEVMSLHELSGPLMVTGLALLNGLALTLWF